MRTDERQGKERGEKAGNVNISKRTTHGEEGITRGGGGGRRSPKFRPGCTPADPGVASPPRPAALESGRWYRACSWLERSLGNLALSSGTKF